MIWLTSITLFVTSAVQVSARVCTPPGGSWNFTSQASVDHIISNCTILNGTVNIDTSYSGPFVLSGITNITDGIQTFPQTITTVTDKVMSNLTSIELPDLLDTPGIYALNAPALSRISAPKMSQMTFLNSWLLEYDKSYDGLLELDFPALVNLGEITVMANLSSINFNRLETAGQVDLSNSGNHSIDLDFPSLQNVPGGIDIDLSLSSFSAPLLQTVSNGSSDDWQPQGMVIKNRGKPLLLSFPQLRAVGQQFTLSGNLRSLSVPALTIVYFDGINIQSNTPFSVDFTSLTETDTIEMQGNISEALFPALKAVDYIKISSSLPFNCTSYYAVANRSSVSDTAFWSCDGYTAPSHTHKAGLSQDAKIGIGVGIGAGGGVVIILFGTGMYIWRKKRKLSTKP